MKKARLPRSWPLAMAVAFVAALVLIYNLPGPDGVSLRARACGAELREKAELRVAGMMEPGRFPHIAARLHQNDPAITKVREGNEKLIRGIEEMMTADPRWTECPDIFNRTPRPVQVPVPVDGYR
ncbi:MAG: hypothetical protein OYL41_11035 [Acidobacteriota bacterium]|nr:hypothetical protein [Acidobacteriota bacterium]